MQRLTSCLYAPNLRRETFWLRMTNRELLSKAVTASSSSVFVGMEM